MSKQLSHNICTVGQLFNDFAVLIQFDAIHQMAEYSILCQRPFNTMTPENFIIDHACRSLAIFFK